MDATYYDEQIKIAKRLVQEAREQAHYVAECAPDLTPKVMAGDITLEVAYGQAFARKQAKPRKKAHKHLELEPIALREVSPDDDLDTFLQAKAENIRARMKRSVEDIIAIGQDLIEVKERLEHGEFLAWVEAEFRMSDQTAENFMHVAKRFADKIQTVWNLPARVVYELAAPGTPDEVVRKVEAGEIAPTLAAIRQEKQAEKQARDAERVAESEVIEAEAVVVEPATEQDPVEQAKAELAEIEAELEKIKAKLVAWWDKSIEVPFSGTCVRKPVASLLEEERQRVSSIASQIFSLL